MVPVIAVVSDAAGGAAKAHDHQCLLILWRPGILTLDCFSQHLNLSVGGKA